MPSGDDFESHEAYRIAGQMVDFIYDLEDRFPADEMPVLFQRLRAAAVDVGARIAEGLSRDELNERGGLSAATIRDVRAALGNLRHYVLTAQRRFFLDEHQAGAFDDLCRKMDAALATGVDE